MIFTDSEKYCAVFIAVLCVASLQAQEKSSTHLSAHKTLLLAATLDGTLIAVHKETGNVQWTIEDDPVIQIPTDVGQRKLFLPDPKDGSLYVVHSGEFSLKKLPFTIPELVSASPCRSSDGFLYTGKKLDTWFVIDPLSGTKREVLSAVDGDKMCPDVHNNPYAFYMGKSVFSVTMHDAKTGEKLWNVTYSCTIPRGLAAADYELAHFTAASSGLVATVDKATGSLLWIHDYKSPVIGMSILDHDGLHSIPFSSISAETLTYLTSHVSVASNKHLFMEKLELYPRLFVGKWKFGLYALPSLVDGKTLDALYGRRLLTGPDIQVPVKTTSTSELQEKESFPFESVGYYDIPDYLSSRILHPSYHAIEHQTAKPNEVADAAVAPNMTTSSEILHPHSVDFYAAQLLVSAAVAVCLLVAVTVFLLRRCLWGTDCDGDSAKMVVVGKISFAPDQILGKGCDGTFVFRGTFDCRPVAVKRLLPECFSLGEREVELLREADSHPHVVRYFCAERDKQFHYIALQLCSATLSDYVEDALFDKSGLDAGTVLEQATLGLQHLHSLNIVHRDLKPANVLISLPSAATKQIRVMISDFGLCKKLNLGKASYTKASRIAGTEGWIAPEMLTESVKKTLAVDIFSLGCIFFYVLSGGGHPFGDSYQRQLNITKGRYNLNQLQDSEPSDVSSLFPSLIEKMISSAASERPPCSAVVKHPAFWSNERKLQFFMDVSDRVEKEMVGPVLQSLERGSVDVVKGDWRDHIGSELRDDLKKFRSYKGRSVKDLLRALRNKKHHYRELPDDVKSVLGCDPNDFVVYFTTRFPQLLPHTYYAMQVCKEDVVFKQYYCSTGYNFAFPKPVELTWWRSRQPSETCNASRPPSQLSWRRPPADNNATLDAPVAATTVND